MCPCNLRRTSINSEETSLSLAIVPWLAWYATAVAGMVAAKAWPKGEEKYWVTVMSGDFGARSEAYDIFSSYGHVEPD